MFTRRRPESGELDRLLALSESHFADVKSFEIKPGSLQESFVAFANADGGDLYVGVEDKKVPGQRLRGFKTEEDANGLVHTLLTETTPAVEGVKLEFIESDHGLIAHFSIPKSPKVHYTSSGDCYIRVSASKKKIKGERVTQLGYSKGSFAFERQPVSTVTIQDLIGGRHLARYQERVESSAAPETFLRRNRLLSTGQANTECVTVAACLLFDNEPQATLDGRCAVKVYRLQTSSDEYKREQLQGHPKTINGTVEEQIAGALEEIKRLLNEKTFIDRGKSVKMKYPSEAISEIVVNAVIHRDYSLSDDIHIKIYDNRVEIISPGKLPGYISTENIYEERFSRNPNLVRMLHNLPNPVNHDIGEGLDTARNELRKAGLVPPVIEELNNAVRITIRHQRLATIQEAIEEFFRSNPESVISNSDVREITGEDDINKIQKTFKRLRTSGYIEPVDPKASRFSFKYKLKAKP